MQFSHFREAILGPEQNGYHFAHTILHTFYWMNLNDCSKFDPKDSIE